MRRGPASTRSAPARRWAPRAVSAPCSRRSATAVAAAVWLVLPQNGLNGAALVLLVAALVVPVLLPRAGLLWSVPMLAPLLGAAGLAPLYLVVAGFASTAWRRAGLAAAGFLWLL